MNFLRTSNNTLMMFDDANYTELNYNMTDYDLEIDSWADWIISWFWW